jgi:hypothetical protein
MPRAAEAHVWWAEVEDVRERIERRRARERRVLIESPTHPSTHPRATAVPAARRGVRDIRPGRRLMLVETVALPARDARRRSRPRAAYRVGPRPDRIAAWAVALGFLLVVVAILSAHG